MDIRKLIETVKENSLEEGILNESSFSESKLKKVSELLATVMGHELGSDFKLLGGSFGLETFKKKGLGEGKGYKFMNEKGEMIRFGWLKKSKKSKFQINVVDFWNPKDGKKRWDTPSVTVKLADWLNIVDVVKEMKYIITNGTTEGFVSESLENEKTNIFEAATTNKKLLSYAAEKGVEFDGESTLLLKRKIASAGKWDEEEYRGFKVVKNQREINSTENSFKNAENTLKEKKWSDPDYVFDDIEKLTKIVATGGANGLIVAGIAGVGKTFHVEKTMKEILGSTEGPTAKWRHRKGAKLSPFGLYMDLFVNRDNKTIVYDDSRLLVA